MMTQLPPSRRWLSMSLRRMSMVSSCSGSAFAAPREIMPGQPISSVSCCSPSAVSRLNPSSAFSSGTRCRFQSKFESSSGLSCCISTSPMMSS
uniref:Putative secreted protein n=1 Tax=Anopheles triannulatus TaxID=58253 RepID=A0A2M4B6R7_9DIPT